MNEILSEDQINTLLPLLPKLAELTNKIKFDQGIIRDILKNSGIEDGGWASTEILTWNNILYDSHNCRNDEDTGQIIDKLMMRCVPEAQAVLTVERVKVGLSLREEAVVVGLKNDITRSTEIPKRTSKLKGKDRVPQKSSSSNIDKSLQESKRSKPVAAENILFDIRIGDRVRHWLFGDGLISDIQSVCKSYDPWHLPHDDYEIEVDFVDCGRKKLVWSLAKLEKINP